MSKDEAPQQHGRKSEVEAVLAEANESSRKDNAMTVKNCVARFKKNVSGAKATLRRREEQLNLLMKEMEEVSSVDDMVAVTEKWNNISVVS